MRLSNQETCVKTEPSTLSAETRPVHQDQDLENVLS